MNFNKTRIEGFPVGNVGGIKAEMEVFDRLPPEVRRALNDARFKFSVQGVSERVRACGARKTALWVKYWDAKYAEHQERRRGL